MKINFEVTIMKNILYISYSDDLNNDYSGVTKKIKAQSKAMEALGNRVYIAGVNGDKYSILNEEGGILIKDKSFFQKRRLIFSFMLKQIIEKKIDIVYLRMMLSGPSLIVFLRELKKKNVKIIMEVPTYPYDHEAHGVRAKVILLLDRIYRKKYSGLVDRIVTFSDDLFIFNISCINVSNAVDESLILKKTEAKEGSVIKFISVSSLYNWHGVDRFIKSIENYYIKGGCLPIEFNIVGPNNDISLNLEKIVQSSNVLKDRVFFLGYKNSLELAEIYKAMHIGVGSLARHRSKVFKINTLKNKEYGAYGLPIIYSESDKDFDNQSFVYRVNPDETLIDIDSILFWYSNRQWDDDEILNFTKKFTWKEQMNKVLNLI